MPDIEVCPIPTTYVPLSYTNDPETEDLIFGDDLAEGMVVVIEDTILRANPDRLAVVDPYEAHRVAETARWCRVERLRPRGEIASFVAVYADGSKTVRSYHSSYAWFVKIASMPASAR